MARLRMTGPLPQNEPPVGAELARISLERLSDFVYWLDSQGTLVDANRAACERFGCDPGRLAGRSIFDIDPSMTRPRWRELWQGLESQGSLTLDTQHHRLDGSTYDVSVNAQRIEHLGEPLICAFVRDVSERLAVEEQLRLAIDSAKAGLWDWDIASDRVATNAHYHRMLGEEPPGQPMTGAEFFAKLHEADRTRVADRLRAHQTEGDSFDIEFRLRRPDGSYRWVRSSGKVVERGPEGDPLRMVGQHQDVHEQRLARQRAENAERRAQDALERIEKIAACVPGVVYQFERRADGSFHFPYVSPGLEAVYGLSVERVLRDPQAMVDAVHPDDRHLIDAPIDNPTRTLTPWRAEYRVVHTDGSVRWVLGQANPERRPDGSTLWFGHLADITEQKNIAEKVERNAALRTQTGRMAQIGGWELDLSGDGPYWSDEVCKISGVDPGHRPTLQEAIGFYPEHARPIVERSIADSVATGEPFDFETEYQTAQGKRVWVRSLGEPVFDDAGRCVKLRGAFQDITERKHAALEAEALEARMRLFIEHTPAAVAMFDTDMRYLVASRGWYQQYGLEGQTVLGRSHYEVFSTIPDRWKAHHQRVLAGESLSKERDCFTRENGEEFWVRWALEPWRLGDGRIGGLVMFTEVITEQVHHERHLSEARHAAEAASRAKTAFLANMSHEIRTPMTAILGFADLLEGGALDPDAHAQAVDTIRRNGSHLLTIINDVLDLSKIEAGKMTVERVQTDVLAIVDEVCSLLDVRARGKGLSIRVESSGPIPASVRSDPVRVRQVLMNLVGNAVKFTEQGEVVVRVACHRDAEQSDCLSIEVVDTGIGMSEAQCREAFDAFTQADESTVRRFGGSGLGLRISKSLTEMLGGHISVRSEPGRGSTFRFTIDPGALDGVAWVEPDRPRAEPKPTTTATQDADNTLDGLRLLLAEDGPDNQKLIGFHLRKAGADLAIVDNGQQAVDLVVNERDAGRGFDVVLMDMQMPELDGYGATRRLRELGFDGLPILALTAHAMSGDRERCLHAGCDDYLTKPIQPGALRSACGKWASEGRAPGSPQVSDATAAHGEAA
ncbi:MAG: PAS domain S-box protein [Planctomycetota bacterium]